MRKTYRYKDLSFPVADDTEVVFTVQFISDGNIAQTVVNIPGDNDPDIKDSGSASLGKGKDLRSPLTVAFSDISNPVPEEDEIRVQYKINGQLLQEHVNPKSVEKNPFVVLSINFPPL